MLQIKVKKGLKKGSKFGNSLSEQTEPKVSQNSSEEPTCRPSLTAALPADDLADYRLQIFYRYYMLLMSQNGKWLWLILPYLEIKDS